MKLEKIYNLDNDRLFRHAVPYSDAVDYKKNRLEKEKKNDAKMISAIDDFYREFCDLVLRGELDATDLKIIQSRDCSPMPSEAGVGRNLGLSRQAIHKRLLKIRSVFSIPS